MVLPVLFGALAGLLAGSFLATLALRWPRGMGIARGRSRCDGCGRPLGAAELVPLASHVLLGGRCRTCGSRIDPRHPAVEGGAAAIGAAALALHPDAAGIAGALFGWGLLTLAVLDLDHLWLPDALTLPLAAAGLAAGLAGVPPMLGERALGGAAGFLMLEGVRRAYRRARGQAGMGAGDPKLFGAIGTWLGWAALPAVLCGAALLGLAAVLALRIAGRTVERDTPLPFGALLAAAGWIAWLAGG